MTELVRIGTKGKSLVVSAPYSSENVKVCREIPDRRMWDAARKAWICRATPQNVLYLSEHFPSAIWEAGANEVRTKVLTAEQEKREAQAFKTELMVGDAPEITDYRFKTDPYDHQAKAFVMSRDKESFALLMEMGTGKTKVAIDTAAWLYQRNEITGVLVVCPNSVKKTWVDEIQFHLPDEVTRTVVVYDSGMKVAERRAMEELNIPSPDQGLVFLVMNVEAFSHQSGEDVGKAFAAHRPTLMVVDESTRIKTPSARRTKAVTRVGKSADYRRILTGSPATNSPLDLFAQFKFLDPAILGYSSMYAFRNRFALLGGFRGKEIIGYVNLDELQSLVGPYSYRVTKDECLDLPEKVFTKLHITLTREQRQVYQQMKEELVAELAGVEVTATIVLTQLLRLQQIVGGFLPAGEDGEIVQIPGRNPKIDALRDIAEDADGKMIVWARFRPELDLILSSLSETFGRESCLIFHGGVGVEKRDEARKRFQNPDDPARFFIANPATGGLGLTLTQAKTVVYFSNSFSLEERLQSEDRAHRSGLKHPVTYVDLVADQTIDEALIAALRSKKSLADQITGDNWKEWL